MTMQTEEPQDKPPKKPKVVPWRPSTEATAKAPSGFYGRPSKVDNVIPVGQRKTLLELTEKDCRWPIGTVGDPNFFFCGGEKVNGSYCAYHHRVSRAARGT